MKRDKVLPGVRAMLLLTLKKKVTMCKGSPRHKKVLRVIPGITTNKERDSCSHKEPTSQQLDELPRP